MTNLTSEQLLKALTTLIASGVLNAKQPKAAKPNVHKVTKQIKRGPKVGTYTDQPDKKLQFQSAVIKGFKAKGLKDTEIELYGTGTTGIQTYKGWLKLGRQVKKGQSSVKGCFHYSQTEPQKVTEDDLLAAVAEHRNQEQVPA